MNVDKAADIYRVNSGFGCSRKGMQAILDAIEKEQQPSEAKPDMTPDTVCAYCGPDCQGGANEFHKVAVRVEEKP
jgi:hypothetical protein